jgi:hypothetical protein
MKKLFSYLLISSMVVLSSCTNYDDQFDDLNAQITALQSQIAGFSELQNALNVVKSTVDAIASSVNGVASSVNGQDADFAALQTKLAALETALAAADTTQAVADLQAALDLVKADITDILENYDVYTGDLLIVDEASLQFALDLGEKVTVVSGDVLVKTGTAFGITAAQANVVTSLIKNVVGNVVIDEADAAIDFSALKSITQNLHTGADAAGVLTSPAIPQPMLDELFTVGGSVLLNHQTAYAIPTLKRVGGAITMNNVTGTVTGTLTVDFLGLVSEGNITAGGTANTLAFTNATSVKIAGSPVISLTAAKAISVELHYADTLASLAISTVSATAVTVMAKKVTGAASITATSGVNAPSLTIAAGLDATAADVSFAALTGLGANSTITSASASLPVLATVTGTLDLVNTTPVSLPVLKVVGVLTANNAVSFAAPVLAATVGVSTVSATTIELASIEDANLTATSVTSLKLNSLVDDFSAANFTTLTSVDVTGKATFSATPAAANNADFAITSANAVLASAKFAGEIDTVSVSGAAKLTTLSTSGAINSLTVNANTIITALDLNHTHIVGGPGSTLVVTSNPKLTSLKTSSDKLLALTVTGNVKLTSLDASSYVTPLNSGAPAITISGNMLAGNYVDAVAATATTDYTEAVITSTDLLTLKDYVVTTNSTISTTLSVDLDSVTVGTGTVTGTLSAAMHANEAVSTVVVANATNTPLDAVAEFALVKE